MRSIRFRFPLAALLFAALASVSVVRADVLDTSLFAKKIHFTVSGYAGASTLANFPVLVRLSDVSGFNFADFATPADELRFTDAAGNSLNYEIDTWDSAAGKALVWVSVPSISGTTTEIRAYFLPSSTSALPAVSSSAVWTSAGYVGVWHMNAPSTADASNSGNDGTAYGDVSVTAGVVGSGLAYPNTNSYVSCGSNANLSDAELSGGYTIEGWVNLANTSGKKALFGKSGFISYRMEDKAVKITTPKVKDYNNVSSFITTANEWHHFAMSFVTNTTNGAKHYADGVHKASQTTTGINNVTGSIEMWLGRNQWEGAESFLGRLDEYRLSASIRSADWIAADYATQNNPTFLTAGPVIACRALVGISLTQNGGTCALFSSTVDGISFQEGESATLRIYYGTAADALSDTVAAANPVAAAGAVPVMVTGLQRGTTYYFKAGLEMPGGQNVESEVLSVTTLTDYTPAMRRIEYIESTGTQHIDSRYYPTPNTHVKADYQYVAFQNQNRVFGVSVSGGLYFHAYINGNGKFAYNLSDTTNWQELNAKGNTNRNLYDFNYIDNGGNHAYTIYGPDGSTTITKSPMVGTATKTAAATLAIAAQRTDAFGGVSAGEIAKNHRIYSMTFDEGASLTAALAPVVRVADGAVGLYDGVRDMFLPSASSVSYVPGPTVTTVERYTGTTLSQIDLTFLGAPMARSLCIAYGPGYGGDNPAHWGVTQYVATVAAGETSYSATSFPANWGGEDACALRFYFDDGTPFPLWSDTVVYKDAMPAPIVTGVTVDGSGGDTLVVCGNLSYFPGDDCTLSVRVCTPSGTNVWSGLASSVRTATGEFELTLNESDTSSPRYISPGATYEVIVDATANGRTSSVPAGSVSTKGTLAFVSSSSTVSRRKVTFTGYLSDLGAGNSATVTLYVGETDDESALVAVETPAVRTELGTFSIVHTFDTFEKTYYWQFRAVATTAGGRTYETRTAVASCKTLDTTTYTWQAVGGEWNGDWSDSAHWANNQKGDCLGFPQSTAATVDFKNCTANNPVVVNVDGNYAVGTFKCYGSAASDITFAGSDANTSGITTSSGYTKSSIASDSTLEFRDMALTLKGEWEFLRETAKTNVTIRFSGVVGGTEKYFALSAGYCRAEFLNGTDFTGGTKFNIGGTNTVVVVDDSTIRANGSYGFIFNADCNNWGGLKFYFLGKAPRMLSSTTFYPFSQHPDINHQFIFEVPVGGYTEAPIQFTHASKKMFNGGNATADYHVVISADSPALKRSLKKLTNIPLIYAQAGFDLTATRTMDFEAVPEHEGESCGSIFYATEGGAALDAFDATARKVFANLQGYGQPPTMFFVY